MPVLDTTPIFNLKAVVQETGLKPDTLRAWERRYGLPEPNRTTGGHRLYSQRDIEVLKWLIARQDEGLSISRAVDLWRTLNNEGHDPLSMSEYTPNIQIASRSTHLIGGSLDELRSAWIDACLSFDGQTAESLLAQAFAVYPTEVVCFEVLQRGLSQIGSGWYRGEFTVQQEHFASALAMRRLEALVAASPSPTRAGRILIGCPPNEDHTFSPLLLTLLHRRQGYDVVYLGANVPVEYLEHTIATARPDFVIMAAQQLHSAATLLEVAHLLRRLRIPLAFGGRIFNEIPPLHQRIPGHFLGHTLHDAVSLAEPLINQRQHTPQFTGVADEHLRILEAFQKHRLDIEAVVYAAMDMVGMPPSRMNIANLNFGRNIEAALQLGMIEALRSDLMWIRGLLLNLNIPDQLLFQYIHTYRNALEQVLGDLSQPITAWLDTIDPSALAAYQEMA